ncbi:hypothetical protein LZ31DRAFT_294089 [Colletotrichum somersetense]|nr:hypothetical protein LZ31DRAFT_294089 [Colletotrichum somersetense]
MYEMRAKVARQTGAAATAMQCGRTKTMACQLKGGGGKERQAERERERRGIHPSIHSSFLPRFTSLQSMCLPAQSPPKYYHPLSHSSFSHSFSHSLSFSLSPTRTKKENPTQTTHRRRRPDSLRHPMICATPPWIRLSATTTGQAVVAPIFLTFCSFLFVVELRADYCAYDHIRLFLRPSTATTTSTSTSTTTSPSSSSSTTTTTTTTTAL